MRSSLNKSREFEIRNIEGVDSKRLDSILREDSSERLNQNKVDFKLINIQNIFLNLKNLFF